ncbi:MAG: 50S ribosomal protein L9 [Bacteroidia bacterium]|nr:MAG: 50S ribosomal protein L9 [Bacteroidia bacterium]
MEIILKEDILNLGYKDDIVTVKNGYANNYLVPRGMAVVATKSAKKVLAENLKQRAHKEEKLRKDAQALADKLETLELRVGAKTSSKGKIFGSVTNIQLADTIGKQGIEIDRKKIVIKEKEIKETGKYKASVKLHRDVKCEIEFEVVSE